MSIIRISVTNQAPSAALIAGVRGITSASIASISNSIKAGTPIYEQEIFGKAWKERAIELRALLEYFRETKVTPNIWENDMQITTEVLLNILRTSEEIAEENSKLDELGHS